MRVGRSVGRGREGGGREVGTGGVELGGPGVVERAGGGVLRGVAREAALQQLHHDLLGVERVVDMFAIEQVVGQVQLEHILEHPRARIGHLVEARAVEARQVAELGHVEEEAEILAHVDDPAVERGERVDRQALFAFQREARVLPARLGTQLLLERALEIFNRLLHALNQLLAGQLVEQVVGEHVLSEQHAVQREREIALLHHRLVHRTQKLPRRFRQEPAPLALSYVEFQEK